jgi:hypothetical protein
VYSWQEYCRAAPNLPSHGGTKSQLSPSSMCQFCAEFNLLVKIRRLSPNQRVGARSFSNLVRGLRRNEAAIYGLCVIRHLSAAQQVHPPPTFAVKTILRAHFSAALWSDAWLLSPSDAGLVTQLAFGGFVASADNAPRGSLCCYWWLTEKKQAAAGALHREINLKFAIWSRALL